MMSNTTLKIAVFAGNLELLGCWIGEREKSFRHSTCGGSLREPEQAKTFRFHDVKNRRCNHKDSANPDDVD